MHFEHRITFSNPLNISLSLRLATGQAVQRPVATAQGSRFNDTRKTLTVALRSGIQENSELNIYHNQCVTLIRPRAKSFSRIFQRLSAAKSYYSDPMLCVATYSESRVEVMTAVACQAFAGLWMSQLFSSVNLPTPFRLIWHFTLTPFFFPFPTWCAGVPCLSGNPTSSFHSH